MWRHLRTSTMEEFKELPWKSILEQVPLTDLIKLRRVNQQWRCLIDLVLNEKKELALFIFQRSPTLPYYWHYNDQRITANNSLPSDTGVYESQWFNRQFRDITSLMMIVPTFIDSFIVDKRYVDHKQINPELADLNSFIGQFEKLLHLQIVVSQTKPKVYYQCRIRSKTLQTLHIVEGDFCQVQSPVCENLIEFSTPYCLNIDRNSTFTSKLKYLRCRSLCYERKRVRFPSLEVLVLESQKKPIHLEDFPRLEKLHFNVVEDWSKVFLDVIKAKELNKRPLKIFLSGVHFSFERADFDNESSYWKTIRNLYAQLMALEQRTNCTWNFSNLLEDFWRVLSCRYYFKLFPRLTIDAELLRFYIRCKENFESNRIERTILYSDSFGQTLEALRREDPNMYKSLAKCMSKIFFRERISKESLLNLKDFFEWIYTAYFEQFDQALLDLLPTVFPRLGILFVNSDFNKNYVPINCTFISKLTSLESCFILAKNCADLNDLREIFRNCKYIAELEFEKFSFVKLRAIRGITEGGWLLFEADSSFQFRYPPKKFPGKEALLDYWESIPKSFRSNHKPSIVASSLNKLQHEFYTLCKHSFTKRHSSE